MTDGYKIKRVLTWVNEVRLPSEYQEVEYIESSGTQKISTGYNTNSSIKIEADFMTTSSSGDQLLFGTTYGSWAWQDCLAFRSNSGFEVGAGGGNVTFYNFSIDTKHTLEYTLSSATLDGTTQTYSRSSAGYELTIFYGNGKGGHTRVYSFKIYTGTTLERNFIPCYRKSDNVIGMYDLANDVFYTNSGSGTFTKGADVPDMVEKQIYPASRLPSAYQEVEYIESSGTQRIDTGVNPTDTKFGIKGKFRIGANGGDVLIDLSNTTSTDNKRYGFQFNGLKPQWSGIMYQQRGEDNGTISSSSDYEFSYNYNGDASFTINGITKTGIPTGSATLPNWNIFCQNCNGSYKRFFTGRLYWLQLYHNTELLRDFVPCYRKSDSVIGLYDLVNNVFYTNDGTGTFTKGADVN